MDPVSLTLIIKGLATFALIGGGIMALHYGFLLYRDGAGRKRDVYAFEASGFKLRANSVGSVLMATAFLWAWAAVAMSPSLRTNNQAIDVYSFHTPNGEIVTSTIQVSSTRTPPNSSRQIEALFRAGAEHSSNRLGGHPVLFDGKPAAFDLTTVSVIPSSQDKWTVTANAASDDSTVSLTYSALVQGETVTFVPASAKEEEE